MLNVKVQVSAFNKEEALVGAPGTVILCEGAEHRLGHHHTSPSPPPTTLNLVCLMANFRYQNLNLSSTESKMSFHCVCTPIV